MKRFKITSVITVSVCAAASSLAQPAPAQTETPAPAPVAAVAPKEGNTDRSYTGDYSDKKASITLLDPKTKRETPVTLKSITDSEYIFINAQGGELTVPKNSETFTFVVRDENLNKGRFAYNRGDWNDTVAYMRGSIYPLLELADMPESVFTGLGYIDMYINALISSERYKELAALLKVVPLKDASPSMISLVLSGAEALAASGDTASALEILGRCRIDAEKPANISDAMRVLAELRKKGLIKECIPYYTKFAGIDSPEKDKATLWMVYCDLGLGNKMSAEVYLGELKIDRKSKLFSLAQMDKGMLKLMDKKPDMGAVLDLYCEGIVFGSSTSDWMPELLYKAGMAYKALNKPVASNEIFNQIAAMYPNSAYAELGKKEIVKVEKKVVKQVVIQDDDE